MKRLFLLLSTLSLAAGPRAAELSQAERESLLQRAEALQAEKKCEDAVELIERALSPGVKKSLVARGAPALGRCQETLGNFQRALAAYQQAHALAPKDPDRALDLARVYARVDLNDQAADLYREILRRTNDRKDVLLALAYLLWKTGRAEEAEGLLRRYLAWEPRDAYAQDLMARLEEGRGDLAGAARRRESLLAQRPAVEGYLDLARLWSRLNEFDLARLAYKRAEERGADPRTLALERGILDWRRGDRAAAEENLTRALAGDAPPAAAWFFLALNDFDAGRRSQALARARTAAQEARSGHLKDMVGVLISACEKDKP